MRCAYSKNLGYLKERESRDILGVEGSFCFAICLRYATVVDLRDGECFEKLQRVFVKFD